MYGIILHLLKKEDLKLQCTLLVYKHLILRRYCSALLLIFLNMTPTLINSHMNVVLLLIKRLIIMPCGYWVCGLNMICFVCVSQPTVFCKLSDVALSRSAVKTKLSQTRLVIFSVRIVYAIQCLCLQFKVCPGFMCVPLCMIDTFEDITRFWCHAQLTCGVLFI